MAYFGRPSIGHFMFEHSDSFKGHSFREQRPEKIDFSSSFFLITHRVLFVFKINKWSQSQSFLVTSLNFKKASLNFLCLDDWMKNFLIRKQIKQLAKWWEKQCWINSRISANNYQYIIDRHIGKDSGRRDDNGVEVKDTALLSILTLWIKWSSKLETRQRRPTENKINER